MAGATGIALLAASCGGASDGAAGEDTSATSGGDGGKITLTVATFNEFGYEELVEEYMELNPDVTVEHKKAATANEARDNLNTRLAAGSGLSDIEGVEVDWLSELMQYSDMFVDLSDPEVESVETVVARVRRALPHVDAERLVLAPDCGMKYLSRASADGKMRAMAEAAQVLRLG